MFKFYLKINHVFIEEEDNPSNKVAIDEEEIDGIAINGIGNLVDLPMKKESMKKVGILK